MINLRKEKKHERGQIIVLLAVSIVVVMIVGALAVDGGMIYSQRRFSQNVADASSFAAGGRVLNYMEKVTDNAKTITAENLVCQNALTLDLIDKAQKDAIKYANTNLITDLPYLGKILDGVEVPEQNPDNGEDYNLDANHGVVVECVSHQYIEVTVRVTSNVSTAFAHLIYPGDLVTTNEAVSRAVPFYNFGMGNGIISLSPYCSKDNNNNDQPGGIAIDGLGGGFVRVNKGGIHTNSCYDINGAGAQEKVIADAGKTSIYSTAYKNPPHGAFTFTQVDVPYVVPEYTEPTCTTEGQITPGNPTTYTAGYYDGGISISGNKKHIFSSGVYCIRGNFSIAGQPTVEGDGVTFFIEKDPENTDKVSDVSIAGSADVLFSATHTVGDDLFGFLFIMDDDNVTYKNGEISDRGLIQLTGNSGSYFSGTILAETGEIEVGGNPIANDPSVCEFVTGTEICQATTFTTQFIGYTVWAHGSANFEILYDESSFAGKNGVFYLRK